MDTRTRPGRHLAAARLGQSASWAAVAGDTGLAFSHAGRLSRAIFCVFLFPKGFTETFHVGGVDWRGQGGVLTPDRPSTPA